MHNDWLTPYEGTPWCINHHKRGRLSVPAGSNQAFVDGHVELVKEFLDPLDPSYPGNADIIHWCDDAGTGGDNARWWW